MTNKAVRRRRGDRREQILNVALELFTTFGMVNVTTRKIAQAVGISQPSLYAFFKSADDIGDELVARGFVHLHARLAAVLAEPGSPADRIRRLGRAYIAFGLEHPDIYRMAFMLESDRRQREPSDSSIEAGRRAFDTLRVLVIELRGQDNEQTAMEAQSIWACVHGLVSLLLARPDFPWANQERLIAHHLNAIGSTLESGTGAG